MNKFLYIFGLNRIPDYTAQQTGIFILLILKEIRLVFDPGYRRNTILLKKIIGRFQAFPKRQIGTCSILLQMLLIHPERKYINLYLLLPRFKGFINQCINFFDARIRHSITSDGSAVAMHHDLIAGIPAQLFKFVWITNVDGQVVGTRRVKLIGRNGIKTFRAFPIPCFGFCAQPSGKVADVIAFEKLVLLI